MNYSALIVAAGKGTRMGLGYNKMFYPLKEGKTVLEQTLQLFLNDPRCKQVVIVTNRADMPRIVRQNESGKIVSVNGGDTRQDSVFNGLMAVTEDVVLIHDGARPWLPMDCVNRLLNAMEQEDAAILAVKPKDTIKKMDGEYISATVDREDHMLAQTPQAFKTSLILQCYNKAYDIGLNATDDAQIAELCSDTRIRVIEGSYANIKITTPDDVK
ncbi:MAG: 2-C-methyl-D-erythritol 4-phosphate cytidylyltransferase [Erysipelothrix sp.]|nr:2-C-methyl-D-erythritol 4-phosphate cytidylyltransferase [Erysipelothrix sp.]